MNGLLGMISLLQESQLNEEQKEMLSVADACGQTLLNVINDILELCKIEVLQLDINSLI